MKPEDYILKTYILSEVYNIEKSIFLKENEGFTLIEGHLVEGLLVEGKTWEWTKKLFRSAKNIFRLSPEEIKSWDKLIKDKKSLGKDKSAKRLEEIKQSIVSQRFKNQNMLILSTIAVVIFNATGDFNKVGAAIDEVNDMSSSKDAKKETQKIMGRFIPNFNPEVFFPTEENSSDNSDGNDKTNPVVTILQRATELYRQENEQALRDAENKTAEFVKQSSNRQVIHKDEAKKTKEMNGMISNISGIVDLEGLFNSHSEYFKAIQDPKSKGHKEILDAVRDLDEDELINVLAEEAYEGVETYQDKQSASSSLNILISDLESASGELDQDIKDLSKRFRKLRNASYVASKISEIKDDDTREKAYLNYGLQQGFIDDDSQLTDHVFADAYESIINSRD